MPAFKDLPWYDLELDSFACGKVVGYVAQNIHNSGDYWGFELGFQLELRYSTTCPPTLVTVDGESRLCRRSPVMKGN